MWKLCNVDQLDQPDQPGIFKEDQFLIDIRSQS